MKVSKARKEQVNKAFSENALKMMKKRYLLPYDDGKQEMPADMFERVANALAQVEKDYGRQEAFVDKTAKEFFDIMANKEYTPAGRTLTNAGGPSTLIANCIVLPIHDSMESIFQTLKDAALLQQAGCGLGFDLSEMRPANFPTKKSRGNSSGPVTFLKVYDTAFGTIKQQGRHGANMAMMRVDHPDVLDFIHCKQVEGDIRNFNISVTVTDEFMEALDKNPGQKWMCSFKGKTYKPRRVLRHPNGSVYGSEEIDISVKEVFDEIVEGAWVNGEPGVAFVDTWNKSNPLPDLGPLASTNPCITGDTMVPTEYGILRMEELIEQSQQNTSLRIATDVRVPRAMATSLLVGSNIFAGVGEVASTLTLGLHEDGVGEASKVWETGVKPVYKLVTHSGYTIEATKDHKIFTPKGKIPLSELRRGDKILLQSKEGLWSQNAELPFEASRAVKGKNGRTYFYNMPQAWNKELGRVTGWLIGDGWVRDVPKNCTVGLTFSQQDIPIMNELKEILNSWYLRPINEILRPNGVYHLMYHSKYFVEYFKKLGVKPVRAQWKEVPHALWKAPREAIVGFLQGLFSADGTIQIYRKNQTRYIRLTSKSRKLLEQVQILLSNFGIRSTIYNRSRKPSIKLGYQNDGVCFELQVSKANIPVFLEKIGFLGNHYQSRVETLHENSYYAERFEDEIQSIVFAGNKKVYDLTEPLSHSFIANGIVISNCGEQTLHPYDNCNLGSINLAAFVGKDKKIKWERLREATRAAVRLMDNVIDRFDFPVPQVTELAKRNRRIGLGVMGFADMLYQMGVGYNTKEGFQAAEKVMRFVGAEAYKMSQLLAKEKGAFPNYEKSIFGKKSAPHSLAQEPGMGKKMRNAALTTVAPTGSISMMLDTSSGIEPNFALAYIKQDKDGHQYNYLNRHFEAALAKLSLSVKEKDEIMQEIVKTGSIQHLTNLPKQLREIFVVAMDISGEDHMKMQASFQKYVDNSISKTINLPNSATKEEVIQSFISAWKLGCKSCTVYRDGSRTIQILNVGNAENIVSTTEAPSAAKKGLDLKEDRNRIAPRKRPDVMVGKTYRMNTGYGKLYVTVNNDEKGVPFEVFATIGKSGGFFQEQSEAICRLISLSLRSGVKVEEVVKDLKGIRGPMPVFTERGTVLSLPDAIGRVLEDHMGVMREVEEVMQRPESQEVLPFVEVPSSIANFGFMPGCPDCGAPLNMQEGCISCKMCGFSRCS